MYFCFLQAVTLKDHAASAPQLGWNILTALEPKASSIAERYALEESSCCNAGGNLHVELGGFGFRAVGNRKKE